LLIVNPIVKEEKQNIQKEYDKKYAS